MSQISPNIEYTQLPNQYFSTQLTAGKQLLILGESSLGDLYHPTVCTSVTMAQNLFGEGPLVDRFQDAISGRTTGAYLMRMEPNGLEKAYSALVKFPFDLIYIDNFYFNTSYNQIESFIEFAKEKENQGQLIHAFFDIEHIQVTDDVQELYPLIQQLSVPIEDGMEETGKYFSVVYPHIDGHKAAPVYAGLVSSLEPEISPVNKKVDVTLTQELSNEMIRELQTSGIVCFRNSIKKGVVCASSSAAVSTEGSPHKHISNFRIAQAFMNELDEQLDELVGLVGMSFIQDKVETILETMFATYVFGNQLKTGSYNIQLDMVKGLVYVDVELVPIFSVSKMNQSTQVRVRA